MNFEPESIAKLAVWAGLVALICLFAAEAFGPSDSDIPTRRSGSVYAAPRPDYTPHEVNLPGRADYDRLREGMTYEDVTRILGSAGKVRATNNTTPIDAVMYEWEGRGRFGANINVLFESGRLISKGQNGLR